MRLHDRPFAIRYRRDGTIDTKYFFRHGRAVRSAATYEALRRLHSPPESVMTWPCRLMLALALCAALVAEAVAKDVSTSLDGPKEPPKALTNHRDIPGIGLFPCETYLIAAETFHGRSYRSPAYLVWLDGYITAFKADERNPRDRLANVDAADVDQSLEVYCLAHRHERLATAAHVVIQDLLAGSRVGTPHD